MEGILLQLILFFLTQTGVAGVPVIGEVTQPRLVSVLRGKSITINCMFNYTANVSDWIHTVWYRSSPGIADTHYKGNELSCIPEITPGVSSRCVMLLKIENVSFKISDSNYTCVVKVPTVYPPIERRGPGTRLHVNVPPSPPAISITQEELIAGNESVLYCLAGGFYPQNISIKWLHKEQTISHNGQSSQADGKIRYTTRLFTFRNSDGTFNVTNRMIFVPTLQDHGTICTCQVHHTMCKRLIKHITLNVNYGPQPVIHYRSSDSDQLLPLLQDVIHATPQSFLELNCTADSNPASTVIWKKKSWGQSGSIQLAAGVSSSVLKKMSVDDSDSGEYICRAHNAYDLKEHVVGIHILSGLKSSFPVRTVTMPIFVVSVILLLIWASRWKDKYCPRNCGRESEAVGKPPRNSKEQGNQWRAVESDKVEDVDAQKDEITSSEF